MAAAVDVVTVQRGVDPTGLTLFASGGAGPMHVARIAEHFGIDTVLVPPASGVASAIGLLATDLTVERAQTCAADLGEDPERLAALFDTLARTAGAELGVDLDQPDVRVAHFADVRYRGQSHQLTVPAPPAVTSSEDVASIRKEFARHYELAYGIPVDAPTELVAIRVRVTRLVPRLGAAAALATEGGGRTGSRRAFFIERGGFVDVDVYSRAACPAGSRIQGPAIVEEPEATVIIPPSWVGHVEEGGDLVLTSLPHVRRENGA
jgi:N-methylhydantoinase A